VTEKRNEVNRKGKNRGEDAVYKAPRTLLSLLEPWVRCRLLGGGKEENYERGGVWDLEGGGVLKDYDGEKKSRSRNQERHHNNVDLAIKAFSPTALIKGRRLFQKGADRESVGGGKTRSEQVTAGGTFGRLLNEISLLLKFFDGDFGGEKAPGSGGGGRY